MTVTMLEGLTSEEVAAVVERFGKGNCEEVSTEAGAAYVSVTFSERAGVYRAICRHRGTVAMLDEEGRVVAKGRKIGDVLVAA